MTIAPLPALSGLSQAAPASGQPTASGAGDSGFAALVQLLLAGAAPEGSAEDPSGEPTEEPSAEVEPEEAGVLAALVAAPVPPPPPPPPAAARRAGTEVPSATTRPDATDATAEAEPGRPAAVAAPTTPSAPAPAPAPGATSAAPLLPVTPTTPLMAVAPAEPAAAPAAPTATHQVAAELVRLAESGPRHDVTRHVTLQLNPEALGEVRITLSLHAGGVRVRLAAESGVTREALAAGIPQLQHLLGEHAVTADRAARPGSPAVEVTIATLPSGQGADTSHPGEHSARSGADQSHEQRPARMPLGHTATDGSRPTAALPPVDDLRTSGSLGRLDVSV